MLAIVSRPLKLLAKWPLAAGNGIGKLVIQVCPAKQGARCDVVHK